MLTAGPCHEDDDEQEIMLQCYERCLQLVSTHSITSIVSGLASYIIVLGLLYCISSNRHFVALQQDY